MNTASYGHIRGGAIFDLVMILKQIVFTDDIKLSRAVLLPSTEERAWSLRHMYYDCICV